MYNGLLSSSISSKSKIGYPVNPTSGRLSTPWCYHSQNHKQKGYEKPPQFEEILTVYEKECENNEYSMRGMRTRLQRLFFFVDYLSLRRVVDIREITPEIISDYVISICPKHEKSIAAILPTLRVFLRFLYLNGYTDKDLSLSVPKQNKYNYPAAPSTWNPAEVKRKILNRCNNYFFSF